MSTSIGVLSARGASGGSFWTASLAWSLAERHTVTLLDADMSGGTLADLLHVPTKGKSLGSLPLGLGIPVKNEDLLNNSVQVPLRPNLRLISGLHQQNGPRLSLALQSFLHRRQNSLDDFTDDFVVVDLGSPLAYPDLNGVGEGSKSPSDEARLISFLFDRIFIVVRDDPLTLDVALRNLVRARFPQGQLILCQNEKRRGSKDVFINKVKAAVPKLTIAATWGWDTKRVQGCIDTGVPLVHNVDGLKLL